MKDSLERALAAAEAAAEKQAADIIVLNVGPIIGITDYFVICSGASERQVGTIVDEVEKKLRERYSVKPYRREGEKELRWVLLDYLDVVVHVFHQEDRLFYELERLWRDAERVPFEEPSIGESGTG